MKTEIRIHLDDRTIELLKDGRITARFTGIKSIEQGMFLILKENEKTTGSVSKD